MKTNIILLAGGSTGIGLATAELLMRKGHKIYAGSRRIQEDQKDLKSGGQIIGIHLDVTNKAILNDVVNKIIAIEGRIDVLICNAGNGIAGAVEDSSDEEVRFQFETNFFGLVNTISACLPHMRKQEKAKIIAMSSVAAITPMPYQAFYSASKAAVSLYMQALSLEVKQFGIQTCTLLPGETKTEFTTARRYTRASQLKTSAYKKSMDIAVQVMEEDEAKSMPAKIIAKSIARQIKRKKMKTRVIPSLTYKFRSFFTVHLPESFKLFIIDKMYS